MLKSFRAAFLFLGLIAAGASAEPPGSTGLVGPDGSLPAFHEQLRGELNFKLGWTDADKSRPQAWRAAGLAKARELMLLPTEDATPFEPRVLDEIDRGSYVARRIELSLSRYGRVTALMLVPKGAGPFPAALMLHDHGARFDIGKEKLVRPWGDAAREQSAEAWAARYFSGRFPGDELARRGHVVLVADALGWGDRSAPGFQRDSQQALAANLMNFGISWAALIATEDVRLARFLATRPEVDRSSVAAIGFSMGAQRAWQLAALSDDVRFCIAVNWMATLQGLMVPGNNQLKGQSAFAMLHPGLARYLDYPDVAALAAPKSALFYAGEQDALFPPASVAEAFEKLRAVWTANGAGYRLETRLWPGGHQFTAQQQDAAFSWLERRQIKIY
ncbi:dienelactone hydrolase family protein [Pelomonas sp. V22]|uniref:dienelactone hydrolase family protein n=1 Tax=Pelomonas sp. V22 TaxID=2822139 RepID=UPI0024A7C84C|nr:dienelactone hydrolase family protein [Pelomonas sp. V22]MDI4634091.1 dienelactone hydrolase family protein [Pelomonas sp. V22]